MEAAVPWKGGRTVHLVLLFMNSDRGFLLARCSCISMACTTKSYLLSVQAQGQQGGPDITLYVFF